MGRPSLPPFDQGVIVGRLLEHPKRSDGFRRVRRELANRYERTERAIENIYDRRQEEAVRPPQQKGQPLETALCP